MISFTHHDPADVCKCSYCGITEDIHLLDGVLTADGDDSGLLACIKCYPTPNGWTAPGPELVCKSIAPSLAPLYREWTIKELARARHGSSARATLLGTLDQLTRKETT